MAAAWALPACSKSSSKAALLRYPFLRNDPGGDVDIEITADGLCFVNDAGRSKIIDWPQIRKVRLCCDHVPSRLSLFLPLQGPPTAYFCELTLRNRKRIVLVNGQFDAHRQWIESNASYRDFIRVLHERLRAARSRARFRGGFTCARFAFSYFDYEQPGTFNFFLMGLMIWLRWQQILRDFPRRYQPEQVPERLLP